MIEYEITCHIQCTEGLFKQSLESFLFVLEGISSSILIEIKQWLESLTWEVEGSSYNTPLSIKIVNSLGITVDLAPSVILYKDEPKYWIQFILAIQDTEEYKVWGEEQNKYEPWVGKFIWLIMLHFHRSFDNTGVYFNDEHSVNLPWYAQIGLVGNYWGFDAAIIPKVLQDTYKSLPFGFTEYHEDSIFGFAKTDFWEDIPWS